MKSGEGAPGPSELTFPEEWILPGRVLHGQAYVLDLDAQPLDTAPDIDHRNAALIRQSQAIEAEYGSASF